MSNSRPTAKALIILGLLCSSILAAARKEPLSGAAPDQPPASIEVDASRVDGQIRPLHGLNGGPIQYGEMIDLSAYYRELAPPLTRLHDCHWPNPDVVDIHTIFHDFSADPAQPENYDFSRTDDFIQAIVNTGAGIVYRLGESIEHTRKKYYVHPPRDPARWAAICAGIIRHYNEGWARGFRHHIRYWEIWNEPENRPAMWTGTEDEYLRLYEVTAKTLKQQFPGLKVGGPSLGYTGRIVGGALETSPFMQKFLAHCRENRAPLDFFSWHLYTADPSECLIRAKGIRNTLDQFGFTGAESHFNEWNYLPDNDWAPMMLAGQGAPREKFYERMGGAEGAAFSAGVLLNLQDSPVDVANFYLGDIQGFGLFNFNGVPKKNYYAFQGFKWLLDTPQRLELKGNEPGKLAACAGLRRDPATLGILVSNFRADGDRLRLVVRNLPWKGTSRLEAFVLDGSRTWEKIQALTFASQTMTMEDNLRAPALLFVRIKPG